MEANKNGFLVYQEEDRSPLLMGHSRGTLSYVPLHPGFMSRENRRQIKTVMVDIATVETEGQAGGAHHTVEDVPSEGSPIIFPTAEPTQEDNHERSPW